MARPDRFMAYLTRCDLGSVNGLMAYIRWDRDWVNGLMAYIRWDRDWVDRFMACADIHHVSLLLLFISLLLGCGHGKYQN